MILKTQFLTLISFKKSDYNARQRKGYYDSLNMNMKELAKRLKRIESETKGVNVTMIAEKPSVARVMANVLYQYFNNHEDKNMHQSSSHKDPRIEKSEDGFTRFEFYGEFFGAKAFFTITSVFGHIYK